MSAVDELRKWTWECSSLRAFMMISNPAKYASFIGQRLDGKAGPGTDKLDEGWYQDLLVSLTTFCLPLNAAFVHYTLHLVISAIFMPIVLPFCRCIMLWRCTCACVGMCISTSACQM